MGILTLLQYHATEVAYIAAGSGSGASTVDSKIPAITWVPPVEFQDLCRKIAFVIGLVWIGYILLAYAMPSRRSGMGKVKPVGIIAAAFLVIVLLDLTMLPTTVNWLLKAAWWIGGILGFTD